MSDATKDLHKKPSMGTSSLDQRCSPVAERTRFLDPTLDVVFKLLFAGPETKGSLISVLTAVLHPASPIADVKVLNPTIPKEALDDKGIVLDLLVRLDNGSLVDVEMQVERRPGFRRRALYYWAKAFSNQLHRGEHYTSLRPTVMVTFLCYNERESSRMHSVFRVYEEHDRECFGDDLELHLVELKKLGSMTAEACEAEPELVRWSTFFTAKTDEEVDAACKGDEAMEKAKNHLELLSSKPDVQQLAREREMAWATYHIEMGAAREEGVEIGHEKGLAEGVERGKASSLLTILSARGIVVSEAQEKRIVECRDQTQLDEWILRAVTADTIEQVLE